MRLVQLNGPAGRRVAIVEEPNLRLLGGCGSIYELASDCLRDGVPLYAAIEQRRTAELLNYDAVYRGTSGLASATLRRLSRGTFAMPGERYRTHPSGQR